MNQDELNKILESHKRWLNNDAGERANLRGAYLSGACLHGACLPNTDKIMLSPFGWCHVQRDNIRIGCQYHTTEEWRNFSDEEIADMDSRRALDWWQTHKEIVLALAECCEPYGEETK